MGTATGYNKAQADTLLAGKAATGASFTKRATLSISSDNTVVQTGFTDWVQRMLVTLPVGTTRYRFRIRNYGFTAGALTGALTLSPIYAGSPSYNNLGAWLGDFSATPTQILAGATTPSDGSELVTAWVTTNQLTADTPTVFSMGVTCASSSQQLSFLGSYANYSTILRYGTGCSAQAGSTTLTAGTGTPGAFLDIRLEVEFTGRNKVVLVISDSTGVGCIDSTGIAPYVPSQMHTWPWLGAYRNRAVCVNASASGKSFADFTSLTAWQLARFDLTTTAPDDVILGMGLNHAFSNHSLSTFQSAAIATINLARSTGAKRIYMTTVMPVPSLEAGYITAGVAIGVTTVNASRSYTSGQVLDLDYGTSNYETVTVSGTPTQNSDGTYAVALSAATTKAHTANASLQLPGESRRRDYNTWIRTRPAGITGVFEFERPLRGGIAAQPGVPDFNFWNTSTTAVHPDVAAYGVLAAQIELRGNSPEV